MDIVGGAGRGNGLGITNTKATDDTPPSPQGTWESPFQHKSAFSTPATQNPAFAGASPSPLMSDSVSNPTPELPERSPDQPTFEHSQHQQLQSAPPQFTPYRPGVDQSYTSELNRAHTSASGFLPPGASGRRSGYLSPEDALAGGYWESVSSDGRNVPASVQPGNDLDSGRAIGS